jgi:hypothetical protein
MHLWIDNNLKIDNVPVLYHSWCEAEICFISDLHDENNIKFVFLFSRYLVFAWISASFYPG